MEEERKPISEVLSQIQEDKVKRIEVLGDNLTIYPKEGDLPYFSLKEGPQTFSELLAEQKIDPSKISEGITVKEALPWSDIFFNLAPILITGVVLLFLFRQAKGAGSQIFSFGKSGARLFVKGQRKPVMFSDIAGVEEAKRELTEVVDFLKNPGKYEKLGARIPRGVLLVGPPGVGKTMLAKAIANEAGVAFLSMAGSEFMEMLVGVGASVTGDTPILVKKDGLAKLTPISAVVDSYYEGTDTKLPVAADGLETLGFEKRTTGFWGSKGNKRPTFEKSAWKKVKAVFRHKVGEIYEIYYLGGVVRATGDHSVFVRECGGLVAKKVADLRTGEILASLPMNVRKEYSREFGSRHEIKAHVFPEEVNIALDFWGEATKIKNDYEFAMANRGVLSQSEIAKDIGVCQMTISNWQRGVYDPQSLSRKLVKLNLPESVKVTPNLMKLFGYYTAEGRGTGSLEFTFGAHENELIFDCTQLMRKVFNLEPVIEKTESNSIRIKYYSHHLGRFFTRYCGNGCHNKHVPDFIWDLPKEYFLAYLKGFSEGDGYVTKSSKLSMTSVSHQLIKELAWLCCMHGIGVGIKEGENKEGRIIKGKPVAGGKYWSLIIGKTSNPFLGEKSFCEIKRPIIKEIVRKPYDGYVYDLCGCENEAFFGGEKPVLLHNSRVRDLFDSAKKSAPSLIFIDELESIGRQRGMGFVGGHDEREQTLNQILVEMDGFETGVNVIVLAATNRPDLLDPALMRPGRFDRRVMLELPDVSEREAILKIHMRGKPIKEGVKTGALAKRTVGFSGADIENMLNEAAILAARMGKTEIDEIDLEEAATKVKLGPERKRMQSDEEKKMVAYHEAGHAVVAFFLPEMDPVHRVSIVARGLSLGFTMFPPKDERQNETKSRILALISASLGGRAAEELIFNEMTIGASSDLDQATGLARRMVFEFGMSALGPMSIDGQEQMYNRQFGDSGISNELLAEADRETRKIINEAYKLSQKILREHKDKLDKVAEALVKKENINEDEFKELMGNE